MSAIPFPAPPADSDAVVALRAEFRAFLAEQLKDRSPRQRSDNWYGYDRAFSRAMGPAASVAFAPGARPAKTEASKVKV